MKKLLHQAQRLFREGKKQESIMAFTMAIEAGEATEIAFLSRGVAYLQTGQINKAIDDFRTVIGMNDDNIRAHFYRGIAYMSKDDYKSAVRDFDKTIELKPDHGAAFFAKGSAYAQMGREEEASRNIKIALISSKTRKGISDGFGAVGTHFNKALSMMTGRERDFAAKLTKKEIAGLKKWLED
ncbi:MAG: tetratricopeptide repeat protein [Nitrospirae bacterium]|nr:tetratricopeptide repeat protein [Nitrospirota bacterium]